MALIVDQEQLDKLRAGLCPLCGARAERIKRKTERYFCTRRTSCAQSFKVSRAFLRSQKEARS